MKPHAAKEVNIPKKNKYGYSVAKDTRDSDQRCLALALPEVVDMDTLSYALDEELERHYVFMNEERDKALDVSVDGRPWEVEIAYVQRELKIRATRRIAHEKYLRNNPTSWGADQSRQTKVSDEDVN